MSRDAQEIEVRVENHGDLPVSLRSIGLGRRSDPGTVYHLDIVLPMTLAPGESFASLINLETTARSIPPTEDGRFGLRALNQIFVEVVGNPFRVVTRLSDPVAAELAAARERFLSAREP